MHAVAINAKLKKVIKVAQPILVICLTLTQQAPLTSLVVIPAPLMKNKKKAMKESSWKALAKSDAAA